MSMSELIIEGGHPLCGEVTPIGNKNAALPLLAACLLTDERIVLDNVPQIRDVQTMLEILVDVGVKVDWLQEHSVALQAENIVRTTLDSILCEEIRASILFAGPMLARCHQITLPPPGGDIIGRRRVDTHLHAFQALGAEIEIDGGYTIRANELHGDFIFLDEASVTGTENALMAASMAKGTTVIYNAASEPHVQELARFLNLMGAQIEGIGSNKLTIHGVDKLHGAEWTIGPDHIEVGSFIGLAAATGGALRIKNAGVQHLHMMRLMLERLGVRITYQGDDVLVSDNQDLCICSDWGGATPKIDDGPWPHFPTDMMSIALVIATQARGTALIWEKMFEGRLFFADKLISMGARIVLCDPHRAVVIGPSRLHGAHLSSPDIRAGMALLIAALCADGTSRISNINQIDRGYERIEARLKTLGACVERIRDC
ncbi:MAG: UDP-N-acetylglucosamine 1-carboxyvinyltransferase [Anaerolineae bacterium]|nr:UDP-N-acetylglucosamine 1-carboxyvinyltransferase [Anaerolineae bacterium]